MKKKKVLVIDDNEETLEAVCLAVKQMKFGVVVKSSNAEDAFNRLGGDQSFDLVICDWNMPAKSGVDLLEAVRKQGILVPFIMVTARNDVDSVLLAKKMGVSLYICKPFSEGELRDKIAWVMKGSPVQQVKTAFTDDGLNI